MIRYISPWELPRSQLFNADITELRWMYSAPIQGTVKPIKFEADSPITSNFLQRLVFTDPLRSTAKIFSEFSSCGAEFKLWLILNIFGLEQNGLYLYHHHFLVFVSSFFLSVSCPIRSFPPALAVPWHPSGPADLVGEKSWSQVGKWKQPSFRVTLRGQSTAAHTKYSPGRLLAQQPL